MVRLNFSVRNGKRWDPHAITTLFLPFSARTPHLACGAAVMTEKDHRGNAFTRKPLARLNRSKSLSIEPARFASYFTIHTPTTCGSRSLQESFRVISTARLRTLPPVHLPPIYVVVCNDPKGDLILRLASCLDAFSTYPYPTRLPGRAPGGTTGWPEVGPTRSSRTSVRSPQISNAHNR